MILDLTTYKLYKNLNILDNETQIEAIITAVNERIEKYCRQTFDTPDNNLKLIATNMVDSVLASLNSVDSQGNEQRIKSQSFEGNSITFADTVSQLIQNNKQELNKYRVMW